MKDGSVNKKLKEIIRQAIDLHVHIGPELIPRKFTAESFSTAEKEKLCGAVLKNHFYPTTPFVKAVKSPGMKLYGSVVLNNAVGGLNPEAVFATATVADCPFVTWFPTISAKQFLENSDYEIAPEWVQRDNFQARDARKVLSISILDSNARVNKSAKSVLKAIKETGSVLATGHISWQESLALVKKARKMGIKKIIITHPIYQKINMPVLVQKELAGMGAKIEHCYSMFSIDGIPVAKIARQIKAVGPENCVLSSDVGQSFSPSPSAALLDFAKRLTKEGITIKDLNQMLVRNPRFLVE